MKKNITNLSQSNEKNICDTLRLCERKIAYQKSFDKKDANRMTSLP